MYVLNVNGATDMAGLCDREMIWLKISLGRWHAFWQQRTLFSIWGGRFVCSMV